jgi:hypothetical protein
MSRQRNLRNFSFGDSYLRVLAQNRTELVEISFTKISKLAPLLSAATEQRNAIEFTGDISMIKQSARRIAQTGDGRRRKYGGRETKNGRNQGNLGK